MNILILSWRGPKHPNAGGAEISTHEHAKGWVKAGHNVTLFTSAYRGCKQEEVLNGVNIKRYGRQMFGVQWEVFTWYLFGNHSKFDIVVDQFHGIPFFTPLYVRTKKLAFIHEVTKEVWRFNPWPWPFNKIVGFIGELFEPLIFKLYKREQFLTVSNSTKDDLMKWGVPDNLITVVHNGFTKPKNIRKYKKEKKKNIIFLGSISKDKGIEEALKAFDYIHQNDSNWQFWIVGSSDPHYLRFLKQLSKDLGIDKKVKFWGFVTEEVKYELLAKARILINPSVREGWGLVVLEAASVGTPTVGYNVSGLRDSILDNKTGILCKPLPQVCADSVLSLVNDQKKYNLLSRNCVNWSKKFKWEDACKYSLKLIQTVVKSR